MGNKMYIKVKNNSSDCLLPYWIDQVTLMGKNTKRDPDGLWVSQFLVDGEVWFMTEDFWEESTESEYHQYLKDIEAAKQDKKMLEARQEKLDSIDWEQRRYELTKAIIGGWFANPSGDISEGDYGFIVKVADRLIKELKEKL